MTAATIAPTDQHAPAMINTVPSTMTRSGTQRGSNVFPTQPRSVS